MSKSVAILGCGDVGKRVEKLERLLSNKALCICKTTASETALKKQEVVARALNLEQSKNLDDNFFNQDYIYYFIPPPSKGLKDLIIGAFLKKINTRTLKKIILISTTGVYGNCHGQWINEAQKINPTADRAIRRVDAEQQLTAFCQQYAIDYTILRVPGIYGPEKLPLKRLKQQQPILAIDESPYSNRIHIEDLANIAVTAMHKALPKKIYNVADDLPLSMSEYFIGIAGALKLPVPKQITMTQAKTSLSSNMLSYLIESKRIDNKAILNDLNITLKYPTLESALKDLHHVH